MDVTTEVKTKLDEIQKDWTEFKTDNDKRVEKLEKSRGVADLEEKLAKINAALDAKHDEVQKTLIETKARQDLLEAALKRPNLSDDPKGTPEKKAHRAALVQYMRKCEFAGLREIEHKAMTRGSDPQGGYWVEDTMSDMIVVAQRNMSPMRAVCSQVTISTDAFTGWNDVNDVGTAWEGEIENTGETTTADIGRFRIPVHTIRARPRASQELLEDSAVDVESYLAGKVANKMSRDEGTAFVTGNGVNKPRGFASYATAATADATRAWGTIEHVASGTSGGFGTDPLVMDKLLDIIHALNPAYRAGAIFQMPRATLGALRKVKTSGGAYVWMPGPVTTNAVSGTFLPSGSLMGYGVVENEDVPAIAASALAVWFGNFREACLIVDRLGISVLRDPYTAEPLVKFVFRKRVGGDVVNFQAIKTLKLATS